MIETARTPSAVDRISLVPRMGARRDRELCMMSFVALLAGERHTDRPATACPVITAFVIKINDAIDCEMRQALKPLASEILGTNDGRERERAWFLARTCINEIYPRVLLESGAPSSAVDALPRLPRDPVNDCNFHALSDDLKTVGKDWGVVANLLFDLRYLLRALSRNSDELVASAAAVFFVDTAKWCERKSGDKTIWDAAVAMFSRLCRIGRDMRAPVALIEEQLIADAIRARTGRSYSPLVFWLFPGIFRKRAA